MSLPARRDRTRARAADRSRAPRWPRAHAAHWLCVGLLSGCAAPPVAPLTDPRQAAALAYVRGSGSSEHWYGLYQGEVKVGHMQVAQNVATDFVEITTRILARVSDGDSVGELTQHVVERFDTAPPCRATVLRSVTEGYGVTMTASIEHRGTYYRAQSDDTPGTALAGFQYTLADKFAAQVWLAGTPAVESCLAYPIYSLEDFNRSWLTECILSYEERDVVGTMTPLAVLVQQDGEGARSMLHRARDGRMLLEALGPNSYLRAEPRAQALTLPALPGDKPL
jgi:hypothetical protein